MEDSPRRQGHNFKQPLENTTIFSNNLILLSDSDVKYSVKNTLPCLEASKPLRFDGKGQISAFYRAICYFQLPHIQLLQPPYLRLPFPLAQVSVSLGSVARTVFVGEGGEL